MINFLQKKSKGQDGYTLLFAVLVTAIVLGVAISILSISRKEFLLSTAARESQFAFYAADSGIECAAYYDQTSAGRQFSATDTPATVRCGLMSADKSITPVYDASGMPTYATTTYTFSFQTSGTACADVIVTKGFQYTGSGPSLVVRSLTSFTSRGYNVGWDVAAQNCGTTSVNPKKVERQLLTTH